MPATVLQNDGFIYGLDKFYFNKKESGYISEDGVQAGGDQATTTDIRAAQVQNAVVKTLLTTPGSKTFTLNLIELTPQHVVDVFGGTTTGGAYSAPREETPLEGPALIECVSGHKIAIPRANLTANLAGAINLGGTLQIACTLKVLMPETGSPWKILPSDTSEDLSAYMPVG